MHGVLIILHQQLSIFTQKRKKSVLKSYYNILFKLERHTCAQREMPALVKVLIEENSNKEIIRISLISFFIVIFFHGISCNPVCYNTNCSLILILNTYGNWCDIVQNVSFLSIILFLDENIPFITAGLLETLVAVIIPSEVWCVVTYCWYLVGYDEDILQQF
jgi:hypothetical protein